MLALSPVKADNLEKHPAWCAWCFQGSSELQANIQDTGNRQAGVRGLGIQARFWSAGSKVSEATWGQKLHRKSYWDTSEEQQWGLLLTCLTSRGRGRSFGPRPGRLETAGGRQWASSLAKKSRVGRVKDCQAEVNQIRSPSARPFGKKHGLPLVRLLSQPFLTTAAAAKSLQSCPTLCNPIDGSPPGSPVPGIFQARTLEWVASSVASFSNAWKWKVKVKSLSCAWLLATPWTGAHQALPSMGFSRQEYWSGVSLPQYWANGGQSWLSMVLAMMNQWFKHKFMGSL